MQKKMTIKRVGEMHVAVLTALLLLVAGAVKASKIKDVEFDNRSKSVERTFSVSNETFRLRSTILEKDAAVEIVRESGKAEHVHTNTVARVCVPDVVPGIHNFALSRSGRIIWLVVPKGGGIPPPVRFDHKIYPLLLDDSTQQYDVLRKRISVSENRSGRIFDSINLTEAIRLVLTLMVNSGTRIDYSSGTAITELNIESSEKDGAIISGKLGSKYTFTIKVWLSEGYGFRSNSCVIKEIVQQDELPSVPQAPATDTGGRRD